MARLLRIILLLVFAAGFFALMILKASNPNSTSTGYVAAGVIALAVWVLLFRQLSQWVRKEREELVTAGTEHGLQFVSAKPDKKSILPLPEQTPHLNRKDARPKLMFVGFVDSPRRPIKVFEHTYNVMAGQIIIPITHRVAVMPVPANWPTTRIFGRRASDMKMGIWKRLKPLKLDSDEFNQRFRTQSTDPGFALLFVNPEIQEAILSAPDKVAGVCHVESGQLWYYEKGSMTPESLRRMIRLFMDFVSHITPDLWDSASANGSIEISQTFTSTTARNNE